MSPADLVRAGAAAGLDVLAVTDHDTTAGWAEAAESLPGTLALVRGAELSCRHVARTGESISVHLLAYLFDPAEPTFAAERRTVRESRLTRGRRIVELLRRGGFDVAWDQVLAGARSGTVGRPHIARVLVNAGYVPDVATAFGDDWLGRRGPYWVAKHETDAIAAVGLVHRAGGTTVFAHPRAARRGPIVDDDAISALADAGLGGLEVDHPDHLPEDRDHLTWLASDLGLVTTGGSDYHGADKTVGLGEHGTDRPAYEALIDAATGSGVVTRRG